MDGNKPDPFPPSKAHSLVGALVITGEAQEPWTLKERQLTHLGMGIGVDGGSLEEVMPEPGC